MLDGQAVCEFFCGSARGACSDTTLSAQECVGGWGGERGGGGRGGGVLQHIQLHRKVKPESKRGWLAS